MTSVSQKHFSLEAPVTLKAEAEQTVLSYKAVMDENGSFLLILPPLSLPNKIVLPA